MRAYEALRRVVDHYESAGFAVYEQRVRHGMPALGQLVVVDPGVGTPILVRVLVGKRPPRSQRLLHDRRREGVCNVLAVVDPRDGRVCLQEPASVAEAGIARG